MLDAGLILSLAVLAGRLAGLLRELVLASVFGVSASADVAVLLLTLPDLLVNLLVSGGLGAALVPRLAALDAARAGALFRQVSLAVLALFGALGLALALWPAAFFQLLAPGMDLPFGAGAGIVLAVALALPLTGAAGVAGAYLNAQQRFFVTGCGTLAFNTGVLAALGLALLLAAPPAARLQWLAGGIAAGAALRWGAQLAALPGAAWRAPRVRGLADSALARAFLTATVAAALMLLAPLLVRALASLLGSGAIASFNYAQKLVELPVGILITSIGTVALARLSALHAQGRPDAARRAAVRDTQTALLTALAVALFGCWFADSVVQVLFARGAMDQAALARVSGLTRIAMLSVPMVALGSLASAALNAARHTERVIGPTVGALCLLPLLAWPGLALGDERLLMGAVVAFQAIVAVWLARVAGLPLFCADAGTGGAAVFSPSALRCLLLIAAAALLAAAIDRGAALENHWLRLLLAGAGFCLALLAVRRFLRLAPAPAALPEAEAA